MKEALKLNEKFISKGSLGLSIKVNVKFVTRIDDQSSN